MNMILTMLLQPISRLLTLLRKNLQNYRASTKPVISVFVIQVGLAGEALVSLTAWNLINEGTKLIIQRL